MFTIQTLLVFLGQYKKVKIQHQFWPVDIDFSRRLLILSRETEREREELSDLQSDR